MQYEQNEQANMGYTMTSQLGFKLAWTLVFGSTDQ